MKAIYSVLAIVGLVVAANVSVQATPITSGSPDDGLYYDNSGVYLGTFTGNDNSLSDFQNALDSLGGLFAGVDLAFTTGTLSVYGWDTKEVPDETDGSLVLIGSSNDGKVDEEGPYLSGTWELTPNTETLNFYSVKAGNQFALYYVDPADYEGSWSTSDLFVGKNKNNNPTISHFSGIAGAPAPVPEPATMLLFGTGLVGLAGYRSRKKKK